MTSERITSGSTPPPQEPAPDWSLLRGDFRTVLVVVLDSLRWDTFQAARTPVITQASLLAERRSTYATWTLPSHSCLFAGLLPYRPRAGVAAAATYRDDYMFWSRALSGEVGHSHAIHPEMSLAVMAAKLGWSTRARVAMPVLQPGTGLRHGFEDYALSPPGSGLGAQASSIELDTRRPNLIFINAGETHYPYLLPKARLPHLPGAHGAATATIPGRAAAEPPPGYRLAFTQDDYEEMRAAQTRAAEIADHRLGAVLETLPRPALFVVTADHGELFGEDDGFGHGPFWHPLLFQVPFALGVLE